MKKKMLKNKKWITVFILAAVAILSIANIAVYADGNGSGASNETVTITYTDGKYGTTDTGLFADFTIQKGKTVAGTLILPGDTFAENIQDGKATLLKTGAAALADGETFYFADTAAAGYADDWAYSFTGWKITGAVDMIPGETVFQPGDVILPDTLAKYALGDTLKLEALWGKCYFIQNPYANMKYGIVSTSGLYEVITDDNDDKITAQYNAAGKLIHPIYAKDSEDKDGDGDREELIITSTPEVSSVPTGAADTNAGNNPNAPKATIDSVYADIRASLGDTVAEQKNNTTVLDTYCRVVMLVGELDYYTDSNESQAKYYGYSSNPGSDKWVPVSATYKSLVDRNTNAYNYNYKPRNYSNTLYGNIRLDNINFLQKEYKWVTDGSFQDNGIEFPLTHHSSTQEKSYIEITARFNTSIPSGRNSAISTFRPGDATYVVINGGVLGGMQNQYSSGISTGKQLYWTIGRKARIGKLNCGTTTAYVNAVQNVYYNYEVNILGGRVDTVYGGNNGINSISAGVRHYNLYGDAESSTEYNPEIPNFYGGSSESRLFGDIYITGNGCTKLGNVYGGGENYSAATYGNIDITLMNCTLSGDLYGGGKYGNCEVTPGNYIAYKDDPATDERDAIGEEKPLSALDAAFGNNINIDGNSLTKRHTKEIGGDVTVKLIGTHVKGNVFGSGMGQSQVLSVRNQMQITEGWHDESLIGTDGKITKDENIYPEVKEGWENPIGGYPSYNHQDQRVLVNAWRTGTYTTNAKDQLSFYNYASYASLSLATVRNVDILIENSEIGISGNTAKGNVYGGGSIAKVLENTKITINNSKVWGDVYGGGDGVTIPDKVKVYWPENDNTYVQSVPYQHAYYTGSYGAIEWTEQVPKPDDKPYIEYEWSNDASLLEETLNGIDHERRLLYSPNTRGLGSVAGNCTVVIYGDDTEIIGTVFGGGNKGAVGGDISVTIAGGKIKEAFGGGNQADVTGNVSLNISDYDHDNNAETPNIGGNAEITDAYGGNNKSGSIGGTITTTLSYGNITDHLYGGGNEADYNGTTYLVISGGAVGDIASGQNPGQTVTGCAYGGGNRAKVQSTNVTVDGGEIRSLFGGSYGADITGKDGEAISVTITGGSIKTFLGGNDQSGNIQGNINITVGTANSTVNNNINITNFFGGGNAANYTYGNGWVPDVEEKDYDDTQDATFKGVTIRIHNGTIYQAFGGGVMANIENARMYVEGGRFNFLYGGGYMGNAVYTVIHMHGGEVDGDMLKEGNNNPPTADEGGYVFGGGYDGDVMSASVHIEDNAGGQELKIHHSVFGGGCKADVSETNVVMKSGEVVGSVYGGGFEGMAGIDLTTDAFPVINPDDDTTADKYTAHVVLSGGKVGTGEQGGEERFYVGNVYGGGYNGATYRTHVDISQINHLHAAQSFSLGGNVYGGGHNANVQENTYVHFLTGTINKNIYGGGRNGNVNGTAHVDFLSGEIKGSVYAGGYKGTANATKLLITDELTTINETVPHLMESIKKMFGETLTDEQLMQHLKVNIEGSVFGGGEGEEAAVKGSTAVTVDLAFDFTASEPDITIDVMTQPQASATISNLIGDSYISGNVYGGGDLGQVGQGVIHDATNTATVTTVGDTKVTIKNGHIKGHVFGGGSGVPPTDVSYSTTMGAAFGNTSVTVNGGYIEGNIYGGGTQSRVYHGGNSEFTSEVLIQEEAGVKLAIGGDVFGGGDRGNGTTQNASIPTTIGNVKVSIIGLAADGQGGSNIYFVGKGGVYGDGNLCLVSGEKYVYLTNFNTGDDIKLKTFYSLQRADQVIMDNSSVVLLGAVDLVEEGDTTVYSINRVDRLEMKNGSTFKLEQIVKYLGELVSDVDTERVFIDHGNNGTNGYTTGGGSTPAAALSEVDIDGYYSRSSDEKNVVCVANGLYLELIRYNGQYGTVKGLFTLQLLFATPGEGGGFVYADIQSSTGDFICETSRGYTYTAQSGLTQEQFEQNPSLYYIREPEIGYVPAPEAFSADLLYYTSTYSDEKMSVVDNVGGLTNGVFKFYFWYINGPIITYTDSIVGYIGSAETSFKVDKVIPHHENKTLKYVLFAISGNDVLRNALNDNTYTLVQHSDNLKGQEIALELEYGDISLGFLMYDGGEWKLKNDSNTMAGYKGIANSDNISDNTVGEFDVSQGSDKLSVVLHKSGDVNTEHRSMNFVVEIDILNQDGTIYSAGTSTLIFDMGVAIVRLAPSQELYTDNSKAFAGADELETIKITRKSSFTVEYKTRYIPSAYSINSAQMKWELTTVGYSYYMDSYGHYLTVDSNGKIISISKSFEFDEMATGQNGTIYMEGGNYKCKFTVLDTNGQPQEVSAQPMDLIYSSTNSVFPKNTKIIMVDATSDVHSYYYYLVNEEGVSSIDLTDFCLMGTVDKISTLADKPAFIKAYEDQGSARVTERLIFIVDLYGVEWTEQSDDFSGDMVLRHVYGDVNNAVDANDAVDIMDYVSESIGASSSYTRSAPTKTNFSVDMGATGLKGWSASFDNTSYYDIGSATLTVGFEADDDWINTQLKEGEYSLYIELCDKDQKRQPLPVGMSFSYNGQEYYPGIGGSYAVIPLETAGSHTIKINNNLYSLKDTLDDEDVYFKLRLYSAPDSDYYDALTGIIDAGGKDVVNYTVIANPIYSLALSSDSQLYSLGQDVTVGLRTTGPSGYSVAVYAEYKGDAESDFADMDWSRIFVNERNVQANGDNVWQLQASAPIGTYRLCFECGDCTEYWYFIVMD